MMLPLAGNVREAWRTPSNGRCLVCDGGRPPRITSRPRCRRPRFPGPFRASPWGRDGGGPTRRTLLQDALKIARGNCAKAARLLQTTERIFGYRLKRHALDAQRFRP